MNYHFGKFEEVELLSNFEYHTRPIILVTQLVSDLLWKDAWWENKTHIR
jgi:hypothetical protein